MVLLAEAIVYQMETDVNKFLFVRGADDFMASSGRKFLK